MEKLPEELHQQFKEFSQTRPGLVTVNVPEGMVVRRDGHLVIRTFYGYHHIDNQTFFPPTGELKIGDIHGHVFPDSVTHYTDPVASDDHLKRGLPHIKFFYTWPPFQETDGCSEFSFLDSERSFSVQFDFDGTPTLVTFGNELTSSYIHDPVRKRGPSQRAQSIRNQNRGFRMAANDFFSTYIFLSNGEFSHRLAIPLPIYPNTIFRSLVPKQLIEDPTNSSSIFDQDWRTANLVTNVGLKWEPLTKPIPYQPVLNFDISLLSELVEKEEAEQAIWEQK